MGALWAWTGVQRGRAGLLGSHTAWRERNKADLILAQYKYNTRLSLPYTSRTHTDLHTHTHTLRVAQWANLQNGLGAGPNGPPCKWSGVEWEPTHASSALSIHSPLSSCITSSLFHSQLKTYLFHKSFPPLLLSLSPGLTQRTLASHRF